MPELPLGPVGCPSCRSGSLSFKLVDAGLQGEWGCETCGRSYAGGPRYIDLIGRPATGTAEHYAFQWGDDLGFLEFLRSRPSAKRHMPAGQLGWNALMAEIRERAATEPVRVYDAGCGFGGVALDLVNEETANHLAYLGADIHTSLPLILERLASLGRCGLLLRMDMSAPPPVPLDFHYVICRAAVHHTPDPRGSFKTLAGTLAPGGKIAISVYRKKSVCREALDDRLRAVISRLPTAEAFRVSREFTLLGRDLQQAQAMVRIEEDLPTLGIPKGEFPIQSLVYDHFLKCFYNEEFGERFSTLVNFDWYHPPYAFRYDEDEIRSWFGENGLEILDYRAIAAQHYFLARRPH